MTLGILIGIGSVLVVLVILALSFRRPLFNYFSTLSKRTFEEGLRVVEERSKDIFKDERERMKEQVEAEMKLNKKEMESKKDLILEALKNIKEQVDSSQKTGISIRTVIEEHKKTTESLQVTAENLKNVLSNNQLRGSWGQEVAEDLLRTAGFVKGENYTSQAQQDTASTIPDLTIFLPDKTKLHIDVKFPFKALQGYQEAEDKNQKKQYLKQFESDIKSKIKEITSRDYINPEENTLDFVLMFIPNEMIFSFIYEKYGDLWRDALRRKVIMAGPFSFVAILRMVKQSYDNFKYQKNIHGIIAQVKVFEQEYEKFSGALDKLGSRIDSASKQYEEVAGTRNRQLSRVIDKIKSEDILLSPGENPGTQIEEVLDETPVD